MLIFIYKIMTLLPLGAGVELENFIPLQVQTIKLLLNPSPSVRQSLSLPSVLARPPILHPASVFVSVCTAREGRDTRAKERRGLRPSDLLAFPERENGSTERK